VTKLKKLQDPTSSLYNKLSIQLFWKDLTFTVKASRRFKKFVKTILFPMTGYANPGETLAIMGPSGSGKTSLLNILARRVPITGGEVLVNGEIQTKKFKSVSAYVTQDDILNGHLTVIEVLLFTAALRLPTRYSLKEKFRIANDIIDSLGLRKTRRTTIGIPGITKGISGGERKRVSIAVELLTSPSVLFLDEPTSGLDAKTALNIVETIIKLSRQNRTVVFTIHQPRSDIYALFDNLLLLARGKVAYFGKSSDSVQYFKSIGYHMPEQYNPADYFIDLVTQTANDGAEYAEKRQYENHRIEDILAKKAKDPVKLPELTCDFHISGRNVPEYSTSWFNEFIVLLARASLSVLRDRMLTLSRLFQTLVMAILVGLLYLNTAYNQSAILDRVGVLFLLMVNQLTTSMFGAMFTFEEEKKIFNRERSSKTYRVTSYYLSKTIAEIPLMILWPIILASVAYYMIGLNPNVGRFFIFMGILVELNILGQGFGILVGTSMPTQQVAMAIHPVLITIMLLFGGFYVNESNIPDWLIWLFYISPFKYAFEALMLNEFTGETFICTAGETVGPTHICPITQGSQVLAEFSMQNKILYLDILTLLGMLIAYRCLAYLSIRYLNRPKVS